MLAILQWIEVADALPPAGTDVLLACADGVQQGVLRGGLLRSCLRGNAAVHDATHWMRLPAHPLNEPEDDFDVPAAASPHDARPRRLI